MAGVMWHQLLFAPPLLCFLVAVWGMWEPEQDPRFGWLLAALGLELIYLADQVWIGAPWPSIFFGGVVGTFVMLYCLKKTVKIEQISKGIRERRGGCEHNSQPCALCEEDRRQGCTCSQDAVYPALKWDNCPVHGVPPA